MLRSLYDRIRSKVESSLQRIVCKNGRDFITNNEQPISVDKKNSWALTHKGILTLVEIFYEYIMYVI